MQTWAPPPGRRCRPGDPLHCNGRALRHLHPRPMQDEDILDRLSQLVRTRRAALAALARAEGVTPEDAVDCVQEGLCTLLERTDALPADDHGLGGVLATTVRNAARNRRRRHFVARPHLELDEHPEAGG